MIVTKGLSKFYGKLTALRDLSMTVNAGDIYGFIGPNGAGKSTTFKILATILRPDRGSATIDGLDLRSGDQVRARIGYMPDVFGVYEDMSVAEYLEFFAAAYYIKRPARQKLIADILQLTDLTFKKDAMVQSLSRGMQQRLGVARVLVHDPKVLILDEPASGLDPRARIELRELLKELARMGKTILISSHVLADLAEICSRIGIIEQGQLIFEGTRNELNAKLRPVVKIDLHTAPEDHDRALALLTAAPFTGSVTGEQGRFTLELKPGAAEIEAIPALLVQNQIRLRHFHPEEPTLEQAFMSLTQGKLA